MNSTIVHDNRFLKLSFTVNPANDLVYVVPKTKAEHKMLKKVVEKLVKK